MERKKEPLTEKKMHEILKNVPPNTKSISDYIQKSSINRKKPTKTNDLER